MTDLLRFDRVSGGYGEAIVIENISFQLSHGESLALLGRNGVGKSTLLSVLVGAADLVAGSILFDGHDLATVSSQRRAQLGLGWVPQERDIFPSLTVEENLTVTARPGLWNLRRVYELFPRLEERRMNLGNQLSGGEQQMAAIGRALLLNPKLLLLDEPLEGLAPIIVQELLTVIRSLISNGDMGVIIVEQHAKKILPLARQALVLERGQAVYSGASSTLIEDVSLLNKWLDVDIH